LDRKIIASLLVIGVVGAFATGSTFALFNDTETSSENTFRAGAFDIQIDYTEMYNGEMVGEQDAVDNPEPIFQISDVKPGDQGETNVSIHNEGNPALASMTLEDIQEAENGCAEPESVAENGGCGTDAELDENLQLTITENNGNVVYSGTAANLQNQQTDLGRLEANTTEYITVDWNVPRETGNEAQTDSYSFDMSFTAEQARHNTAGTAQTQTETSDEQTESEDDSSEETNTSADTEDGESSSEADSDASAREQIAGNVECDEYESQVDAQDEFDEFPELLSQLDADGDGLACEALP
jgi:predicted ribosomally synthesized peptide with SipW-like signal peptide